MTGKQLKNSILQWAIQGKLVPPACLQAGKPLMMNPLPRIAGQKAWFTYVIECEDGSFYKGYTDNLIRRYKQHCDGKGAEYTKTHKPKQLFYWEMHYSEEEALAREKYLKSGVGREWFKREVVEKPENWEPASVLLEKIRAEKTRLVKEGKIKKDKNESIIYRGLPDGQAGDDNSYYEKFADGTVVCIDDEIPFEVPKGWEWVRLGNCVSPDCSLSYGIVQPMNNVLGGIPVVRPVDMNVEIVTLKGLKHVAKEISDSYQRTILKGNEILFCVRGTVGKISIASSELKGANVTRGISPIRLDSDSQKFYCYYCLQSPYVMMQIDKYTKGAALIQINIEDLKNLIIPLPPLAEQYRIVDKIQELLPVVKLYDSAQSKLDRLNKEIKLLLSKSILQEAIQGHLVPQDPNDEPASILLKHIKEEKQRLVKEGKLKKKDVIDSVICKNDDNKYYEQMGSKCVEISEEIPFDIPESWVWCRLSQCCLRIFSGKSPKYSKTPTSHIIIGQQANQWGGIEMRYIKYGTEEYSKGIDEYQYLSDGDILLNTLGNGTLGRCGIFENINKKVLTDGHLFIFRTIEKVLAKYILYYLTLNYTEINRKADGSTNQIFLNIKKVSNYLIPLPPLNEIERIVQKKEELYSKL